MRAKTKKKHEMGKRFAILIGVAAIGVMALGAQTGTAASEGVVEYGTKLTIYKEQGLLHGEVKSKIRPCWEGREVILFKKRPGPDRKLGATRSGPQQAPSHNWYVGVKALVGKGNSLLGRVYAKVTPKVGDGFVCRADRSRVHVDCPCHPENYSTDPPAPTRLRAQTALAGGDPVDRTPPDLKVWGPKKQSPQNTRRAARNCRKPWSAQCHLARCGHDACNLEVQVSGCGDEACTIWATGKLTNVKMDKLSKNGWLKCAKCFGPLNLGPELAEEEQREEVRKALDNGENVKAKVTVRATDAAGNVATAKRTITLVK